MLKVMLADSDTENLRNFKTYIRMAFQNVRIVGNASGADLITQIKELAPDLIIGDIHFFGTNATQKLRDVYEFFPDKRFILYGTYSDTVYLEKALEYGTLSYMYRPVKPQDLERALNSAQKAFDEIARLNKERERLVKQYSGNIDLFRDRFLENLTGGHLTDRAEIMSGFDYFGIKLTPGYIVFTVRIDHFKKIILTLDEMEKYLLVYRILLTINEGLKRKGNGIAVVNRLNTISVIMGGGIQLDDAVKFCDGLRVDIRNQVHINATIGLGRMYEDVRDICVSYRESESALRYRHYMGYNTVIPIHFVEPLNNITYRYPTEKEERLVYSAVTGEYESCRDLLEQIIAALKLCEPLPAMLIPKIIMAVLFKINRFASEQHMSIEDNFSSFFPSKEVVALKTLDEARGFLDNALKNFCSYIITIKDAYNAGLVEKAKEYIVSDYKRNVSLASLAAYAGTTPEFLTEVFRRTENMSVYQYAINAKITKAASLMSDNGVSASDAASAVGYDDKGYFNAVFKQHRGMTADEFRKSVR